jgi:two-component system cell cycle sensor histidine kinase PleC
MIWEKRSFPNSDDGRYAFDPVWLCFRDHEIEKNFVNETLEKSINFVRIYLIAGTALYGLFSLLDATVGADKTATLWFIRYGLVLPVLTGIIISTFFPVFFRFPQYFLGLTMLAAGLGIIAMTSVMDPPFNSRYYTGLVMVVIYCSSLIHLKYSHAFLITIFLLAGYQLSSLWLNPIPTEQYISNNLFLIMATAVGLFSTYFQETYLRQSYISNKIIEERNEQASRLLDKATKADRKKREFLATVSHELRTPLNAIIGFADILSKQMFGKIENQKYAEYADDICASGRHLLTIIDEILDVATFDEADMTVELRHTDISNIAATSARMFETVAMNRNVSLTFAGIDEPVRLLADEKRLRQVLLNLISNAIKFTPNGGHVHVALRASDRDGIMLSVSDTGVGIAPNDIARALKPFEQVENPMSKQIGGTGLGLSISEAIVRLHGGTLSIDSKINVGTTVTVHLPSNCLIANSGHPPLKLAG